MHSTTISELQDKELVLQASRERERQNEKETDKETEREKFSYIKYQDHNGLR